MGRGAQEALFSLLWRTVSHHPAAVVAANLAPALVCALAAFLFLELGSDQNRPVSPDLLGSPTGMVATLLALPAALQLGGKVGDPK